MGLKACIVGSGNWGSAIARIVGATVQQHDQFDKTVNMWVFEEMVDGKKLSEIINTTHENVKYLPGKVLPSNVVAVPDLVESAKDADFLIFVVPHQFVKGICEQLLGKIKSNVIAVSLIKGLASHQSGGIKLISEVIREMLHIDVAVLMGANLAHEVASENFCEATIGCTNKSVSGTILKNLFHTDYFRINVVEDADTVELCGALKNIVACGAGFTDGLNSGDNTKAAVIRLGLMEMMAFIENFYPGSNTRTYFESCGIADLITTCYGGRNRKVSEAFVKTGKSLEQLEKEMLNGQQLQGPATAVHVYEMLELSNLKERFPLFVAIHRICIGELKPTDFIGCLRNHPEHM